MKLIVGMGNPGQEYINTRHNVGFLIVEQIARRNKIEFRFEKKLNAETAKIKLQGHPAILAMPQTFVNKSGESIKKLKTLYKAMPKDIIIIRDDLDVEFGKSKLTFGRGSGGHRGIESIVRSLKTEKIWQLKIGIANRGLTTARHQKNLKTKQEAVGRFVLSRFTPIEQIKLKKILEQALVKLESVLKQIDLPQ